MTLELHDFVKRNRHSKAGDTRVEQRWNRAQKSCAKYLRSSHCEALLAGSVLLSFVLMVLEADHGDDIPDWIEVANYGLVLVYSIEISARVFLFGRWFFISSFNVLDLVIVALEVCSQALLWISASTSLEGLPSVAVFRAVRLLRLARGYKVIIKLPQLALMVKGLVASLSAALYGVAFLLAILTIWSVMAVHLIHPVNQRLAMRGVYAGCDRCPNAFATVKNSMTTFVQQIVAGDSWGEVTIPVMDESPMTSVFFGFVFISVHFTIMNVILAVIVDSALRASQDDISEALRRKAQMHQEARPYLQELCSSMDTNADGALELWELKEGYRSHDDFHDILNSMDIHEDDIEVVFNILDVDNSGLVDYDEFILELIKMKQDNSHTLLVFIKHYAVEIRKNVHEQLNRMKMNLCDQIKETTRQTLHEATRDSDNLHDGPCDVGIGIESKWVEPTTSAGLGSPFAPSVGRRPADRLPLVEETADLSTQLKTLIAVLNEELMGKLHDLSARLQDFEQPKKDQLPKCLQPERLPGKHESPSPKQFNVSKILSQGSGIESTVPASGREMCTSSWTRRGLWVPRSTWGIRTSPDQQFLSEQSITLSARAQQSRGDQGHSPRRSALSGSRS